MELQQLVAHPDLRRGGLSLFAGLQIAKDTCNYILWAQVGIVYMLGALFFGRHADSLQLQEGRALWLYSVDITRVVPVHPA